LGVLTHFKVEVQEDSKHQGSKGMWIAFLYDRETLKTLLDMLVEKTETPTFERNYDFGINILSRQINLADIFPGTDNELKDRLPDDVYDGGKGKEADVNKFKFALIIVYAQWVNVSGKDVYSPDLFNRIKKVADPFILKESPQGAPMSFIMSMWLFRGDREFPYPYVKRTNSTNSTTLSKTGWTEWFSGRIDKILSVEGDDLWVSSQLQVMNGNDSMFRKNANNGTAYSWRNASVTGTWDVFYDGKPDAAKAWQEGNDAGQATHFSKEDMRVLWGSYGDWDMKKVWKYYYEPAAYQKLQNIRKKADPVGIFTANPFAVEAK